MIAKFCDEWFVMDGDKCTFCSFINTFLFLAVNYTLLDKAY